MQARCKLMQPGSQIDASIRVVRAIRLLRKSNLFGVSPTIDMARDFHQTYPG